MRQCMDADNLHRRLRKIIGQVQAIDRMVDEDVPCEDVLAQINAAKSALHGCGKVVLEGTSRHCFLDREGKFLRLSRDFPELDRTLKELAEPREA